MSTALISSLGICTAIASRFLMSSSGSDLLLTMRAILFLDFDGVLHPYREPALDEGFRLLDNPRLFQWTPILATVLAPYDIGIIISSDWRHIFDDETLKRLLGPLGQRFAGISPSNIGIARTRAKEILANAEELRLDRWLALDDDPSLLLEIQRGDTRFVHCPRAEGVSSAVVQAVLKRRLESIFSGL